jgi:hypothetical protein
MLALQFATATANLASQNAFLFLATHGPIFIASSSSATLIQCGFQINFQYRRWNCSPIPPLVVKTLAIGTKSIPRCSHRSLYLLVFVSRPLQLWSLPRRSGWEGIHHMHRHPTHGVADCSLTHYAHINGQSSQPGGSPRPVRLCACQCSCRPQKCPHSCCQLSWLSL